MDNTETVVTVPYEAVILMHADSTQEEQKALFKKNKEIIESFKGKINHVDTWGKRMLATPIGRNIKAVYFHTTFEATTPVIAELERTMKINDRVLRYMHTRLKVGTNLTKHVEAFKAALIETNNRERERIEKNQQKKQQQRKL